MRRYALILTKDKKILIIGLGLIGGSYAKALTEQGYEVGAIARREETVEYALENGFVAHGRTEVDPDYIGMFDIAVFALYPNAFTEWLEKYQSYFKGGAVITDVTGVKRGIADRIQQMLRPDIEYIGAHPMAGKEVYGIENASAEMFKGANYIVTPTDKNTEENILLCEELGRVLGFKTVSRLSPERHDEMIGFLSQLTHCIAVALMTCKDCDHFADYTGDSFRDLTRIAKINENMWTELFLMNKDELTDQMDLFIDKFMYIKDCIAREDEAALKDVMRLSTERRSGFDRK